MIYREMPAIWERSFRERFYARWGRESAVISASACHAHYPDYTQLLSVKMAGGGTEDYFVDGRRVRVDDDTFLILNAGRRYASRIHALRPIQSFSVFFGPGLAEEVQDSLMRSTDAQLADPTVDRVRPLEFDERLREHDQTVTPVLRHIRRTIDEDGDEQGWVDEQLRHLLSRMFRLEGLQRRAAGHISSERPATRRELHRRIGLGVDFIHSHYREPIQLRDMARASYLSPFHFLRTFKAVHGVTPSTYLGRKRASAALRLMRDTSWTLTEIAESVGFGNRTTLFRRLRAIGCSPGATRRTAVGLRTDHERF